MKTEDFAEALRYGCWTIIWQSTVILAVVGGLTLLIIWIGNQ